MHEKPHSEHCFKNIHISSGKMWFTHRIDLVCCVPQGPGEHGWQRRPALLQRGHLHPGHHHLRRLLARDSDGDLTPVAATALHSFIHSFIIIIMNLNHTDRGEHTVCIVRQYLCLSVAPVDHTACRRVSCTVSPLWIRIFIFFKVGSYKMTETWEIEMTTEHPPCGFTGRGELRPQWCDWINSRLGCLAPVMSCSGGSFEMMWSDAPEQVYLCSAVRGNCLLLVLYEIFACSNFYWLSIFFIDRS